MCFKGLVNEGPRFSLSLLHLSPLCDEYAEIFAFVSGPAMPCRRAIASVIRFSLGGPLTLGLFCELARKSAGPTLLCRFESRSPIGWQILRPFSIKRRYTVDQRKSSLCKQMQEVVFVCLLRRERIEFCLWNRNNMIYLNKDQDLEH